MPQQIDEPQKGAKKSTFDNISSFFSSGPGGNSYFKSLFDSENKGEIGPKKKLTSRQKTPVVPTPPAAPGRSSEELFAKTTRFLTHSIVGAPHSIILGRRISLDLESDTGLIIDMHTGLMQFTDSWRDSWVLSKALDRPGKPRSYPSRFRMYLERRALVIAAFGVALSIASVLAHLYLK